MINLMEKKRLKMLRICYSLATKFTLQINASVRFLELFWIFNFKKKKIVLSILFHGTPMSSITGQMCPSAQ